MKSQNIRKLLVLAALACVGIVATQVYWVRHAYVIEAQRFDDHVNIALRNAAATLLKETGSAASNPDLVEQEEPGCFILHINVPIPKARLEHALGAALISGQVVRNFNYQLVANSASGTLAYAGSYALTEPKGTEHWEGKTLSLKKGEPAIIVCFPNRRSYLLGQMLVWIITTLGLLLVLVFLCYLIYLIFKQRLLSEVQKDFIANMTHEFKTPLASIRLGADVLKQPNIVSQPQRLLSYATIISNEAMQLTHQVDRILQMSKAEGEGLPLNRSEFVWQELLRAELPSYARLAAARDGNVSLQLPNEAIPYHGDAAHLKAAINNLVDNAIKYSIATPVVRISLERKGNEVLISVSDSGIGIDKASQRMVFDRFFRVHTGNVHDVKGFGIGLNYVRIIAHAHGGEINCSSQLGKGSTFTLNLPLS